MDNNVNFWGEAGEFLKPILGDDLDSRITKYCKSKGFNENEKRLFISMCESWIGYYGTMSLLKGDGQGA